MFVRRATDAPARLAAIAALSPVAPPPAITTSNSCTWMLLLRRWCRCTGCRSSQFYSKRVADGNLNDLPEISPRTCAMKSEGAAFCQMRKLVNIAGRDRLLDPEVRLVDRLRGRS